MPLSASRVRLVVSDVDGVLTDGVIGINDRGEEFKNFSVVDGLGVRLLQKAGIEVAFLSGRASPIVEHRARGLGVRHSWSGVETKRTWLEEVLSRSGTPQSEFPEAKILLAETCYVGDDLIDLGCLEAVGFSVAVANARPEVRQVADYVTTARGGEGAFREVADLILRARGIWNSTLETYR